MESGVQRICVTFAPRNTLRYFRATAILEFGTLHWRLSGGEFLCLWGGNGSIVNIGNEKFDAIKQSLSDRIKCGKANSKNINKIK